MNRSRAGGELVKYAIYLLSSLLNIVVVEVLSDIVVRSVALDVAIVVLHIAVLDLDLVDIGIAFDKWMGSNTTAFGGADLDVRFGAPIATSADLNGTWSRNDDSMHEIGRDLLHLRRSG